MSGRPRARARLELALAALLFATGGPAIKACTLGAWEIACLRSLVAALTLVVFFRPPLAAFGFAAARVGLVHGATLVLFVAANKLTTASHAIFLQDSSVLYVLLFAPWLLGERLTRGDLPVMLLVVLGMGLLFGGGHAAQPTAPDPALGNLLAAASGVTWALTVVGMRALARQSGRAGPEPTPGAGGGNSGAALAAVILGNAFACLGTSIPAWNAWSAGGGAALGDSVPWNDAAWILYLGAVQIALAYVFVARGLSGVGALEGSLILLVEPVLNSLLTWAVHGESPGTLGLVGGAAILGATAVKAWNERASPRV